MTDVLKLTNIQIVLLTYSDKDHILITAKIELSI